MDEIKLDDMTFENVVEVLKEFGEAFIELYKKKMADEGHIASGQLVNNLHTHIDQSGTAISVRLDVADYYRWIEKGRGPTKNGNDGGPTLHDKIKDWITVKGITPDNPRNLPTEKVLDSFAWAITKKIHKEGTSIYKKGGTHILADTMDELKSKYLKRLEEALSADFNVYSIKILTTINRMIKI